MSLIMDVAHNGKAFARVCMAGGFGFGVPGKASSIQGSNFPVKSASDRLKVLLSVVGGVPTVAEIVIVTISITSHIRAPVNPRKLSP